MSESDSPFKQWYVRNKEVLAEKRKARYDSDPEHREKVLRQNKVYRAKKASAQRLRTPIDIRKSTTIRPVEVKVALSGVEQLRPSYSAGDLAELLGRSPDIARQWEKRGVIPKTPFRGPTEERIYTAEMAQSVVNATMPYLSVRQDREIIFQKIKNEWIAMGVLIDE